jgi:hypothetical protein
VRRIVGIRTSMAIKHSIVGKIVTCLRSRGAAP